MRLHSLVAALLAFTLSAASASAMTLEVAWAASFRSSDPGLVVRITPESSGSFSAPLTLDAPLVGTLFGIFTDESAVNEDDEAPYPISVRFDIINLGLSGVITGTTRGFRETVAGVPVHVGGVRWDAPLIFTVGAQKIGIALGDASFNPGIASLTPGAGAAGHVRIGLGLAVVPLPAGFGLLAASVAALLGVSGRLRPTSRSFG
ncbi:MAG: hypothetical protein EA355_09540 [Rhodobacteraceae bacterium]|nr:MAG: hypothetical protein EA355_09540 [Paracoccaceae bacterium]